MLIWELLGTVIGAGFASGREIATFFAQFGTWGYAGAIIAAFAMVWLADAKMPNAGEKILLSWLFKGLITLMLITTAGAMLSGSSEIAALVLPFQFSRWIGLVTTLAVAWWLAYHTDSGLAWLGRGLLAILFVLLLAALSLPGSNTAVLAESTPLQALSRSLCYSGFNAALLIPVLQKRHSGRYKASLIGMGGIFASLLCVGNLAFRLHPEILHESMPFVALTNQLGKTGFYLCALCLYMSILSTLTACLRSLGKNWLALACVLIVSLFGFGAVVEHAYTFVGALCFILLLIAKFLNCSGRAFISQTNML